VKRWARPLPLARYRAARHEIGSGSEFVLHSITRRLRPCKGVEPFEHHVPSCPNPRAQPRCTSSSSQHFQRKKGPGEEKSPRGQGGPVAVRDDHPVHGTSAPPSVQAQLQRLVRGRRPDSKVRRRHNHRALTRSCAPLLRPSRPLQAVRILAGPPLRIQYDHFAIELRCPPEGLHLRPQLGLS